MPFEILLKAKVLGFIFNLFYIRAKTCLFLKFYFMSITILIKVKLSYIKILVWDMSCQIWNQRITLFKKFIFLKQPNKLY